MFVILLFSLLFLTSCIFEAQCAFCSVGFRGTIDNLDSNQDLQMRLASPDSTESERFVFEKTKAPQNEDYLNNQIYQNGSHFSSNFFIRTSCTLEPCIIEWLVDGKVIKRAQIQEIRDRGIFFDDIYLEVTTLEDNKKYNIGTPSDSKQCPHSWCVDFDHMPNNP